MAILNTAKCKKILMLTNIISWTGHMKITSVPETCSRCHQLSAYLAFKHPGAVLVDKVVALEIMRVGEFHVTHHAGVLAGDVHSGYVIEPVNSLVEDQGALRARVVILITAFFIQIAVAFLHYHALVLLVLIHGLLQEP